MNTKTESKGRSGALGLLLVSLFGAAAAQDNGTQSNRPAELRRLINQQAGGIAKLKVPAKDAGIPLPKQPDGIVNPRYKTTVAKRYLRSCRSMTTCGPRA